MLKLAITGGIACGKSLVGSCLAAQGVPVCDADDLAHAAMSPGTDLHALVVAEFGNRILKPDGAIDRQKLGALVFSSVEKREKLNRMVHPRVRLAWEQWLREREGKFPVAAVIIPLLYEVGLEDGWDAVVCVMASRAMQMARLRARGLSEEEAVRRITAQMPLVAKAERADYVIVNNGSRQLLEEQTMRVLKSIREK